MNNMMQVLSSLADLKDGQSGIIIGIDAMPLKRRIRGKKESSEGKHDDNLTEIKQNFEKACEICEFKNKQCEKLNTKYNASCEQRLLDLGLTPGTRIVVVRSAPFKGPLEILVRGARIALGREIASMIAVELI